MEYGNLDDKYRYLKFNIIKQMLEKHINLNSSLELLDIGGYTGNLKKCLPNSIKYCLIDIDKEAVDFAIRENSIYKGKAIDLNSQPIEKLFDMKFDIIVIAEVLDHLINPANLLKQVRSIIKPDGIVVFSNANDHTLYHRYRVLMGKGINRTPFNRFYSIRYPTITQTRNFLSKYFEIKDSRPWICFNGEQNIIIDKIAQFLANLIPGLFARGVCFLCKNKTQIQS